MSDQVKPNAAERRAHERTMEQLRTIERIATQLGPKIIGWLVFSFLAYRAIEAIENVGVALAGETTNADFSFAAFLGLEIGIPTWVWLALLCFGILAVIGINYGLSQRRLRKFATEQQSKHAATLEQRIDSNRSSSGLNPDGSAPEEV